MFSESYFNAFKFQMASMWVRFMEDNEIVFELYNYSFTSWFELFSMIKVHTG